jgi:hypothetical protein
MDLMDEDALVRVRNRMSRVDNFPPQIRALIYEHGLGIIDAFIHCGVTDPRRIAHLIDTVRKGSGEIGDRSQSDEMKEKIEQHYAQYFLNRNLLVVPKIPTKGMVTASVNALDDAGIGHTVVDRHRKHAVRLIHANLAGHAEKFGEVS